MGDETRVQIRELKKGVEAVGGITERYLIRWLGPLGRKIAESTQTGRYMALAGVVTTVVCLILIYRNSLWFSSRVTKGITYYYVTYAASGYGMPLLIGVALLVFGLMQKKR